MLRRCSAALGIALLAFLALPVHADHSVNINAASHEQLATLTGIGEVLAQRIIDYRSGPDGPFDTKEEFMEVKGIGEKTFEELESHITITDVEEEEPPPPVEEEAVAEEEETEESQPVWVAPVQERVFVHAGDDRTVFVGADSEFRALTEGLAGAPLENARVVWSFGNGDRKEGERVLYNFPYPGTYVVTVTVASGKYSASDRVVVEAIPAEIAITEVTDTFIALKNEGAVEIDLGGWLLFAAGDQFQFPQHTIVLPGEEVLVSNKRTRLSGAAPGTVALQYPNGLVATAYEHPLFVARERAPAAAAAPAPKEEPTVPEESLVSAPIEAAPDASSREAASVVPWVLGLALVVAAAVSSVFFMRSSPSGGYYVQRED